MLSKNKIDKIKNDYPIGTRVKLNYMNDVDGVPSGTCGTIVYVDDEGHLGMEWDNGRTLSLIVGIDNFEIIEKGKNDIDREVVL